MGPKLRRELFCQEYIKDFNAGQAYLRAGYTCSSKDAPRNALRLLQIPEIRARIEELKADIPDIVRARVEKIKEEKRNREKVFFLARGRNTNFYKAGISGRLNESIQQQSAYLPFKLEVIFFSDTAAEDLKALFQEQYKNCVENAGWYLFDQVKIIEVLSFLKERKEAGNYEGKDS